MKKLIAVILSVIMICSVLAPAASAASGKCNCGVLPTIYVGPLGNTDIYDLLWRRAFQVHAASGARACILHKPRVIGDSDRIYKTSFGKAWMI